MKMIKTKNLLMILAMILLLVSTIACVNYQKAQKPKIEVTGVLMVTEIQQK